MNENTYTNKLSLHILLLISVFIGLCIGLMFFSVLAAQPIFFWIALFLFSTFLLFQGSFTFYLMSYAWSDPERLKKLISPKEYTKEVFSFTAIIPARHEASVIVDTIRAISSIRYPKSLVQSIIVCHIDDRETIAAINKIIHSLHEKNVQLVTFTGSVLSKPHALNIGLKHATGDVVAVFDAEDEPHADIYQIINTIFSAERVDVIQSGVQLMNYRSRWFSWLNVLEYYFWFKSFLPYFSSALLVPLGGNTVFFKKGWLSKMNGWDEQCLTEDAEIGIRMSAAGAKIRVVYDEKHVTREETPLTTDMFLRQRTRWNQGFLQVFLKGDWIKLPTIRQRLLIMYILLWPIIQAFLLIYLPFVFFFLIQQKVPILLALYASLPSYLLILQLVTLTVGMYEFTKHFNIRFSIMTPIVLLLTFIPYQVILGFSALRAFFRLFSKDNVWEKTKHNNVHRSVKALI